MTGQMTYNKETKSWDHTPKNKMTFKTTPRNNMIQSRGTGRNVYYLAWSGMLINGGSLEEMIKWVETKA